MSSMEMQLCILKSPKILCSAMFGRVFGIVNFPAVWYMAVVNWVECNESGPECQIIITIYGFFAEQV